MPEFIVDIARRFLASDFYVSLPFWGAFAAVVVSYRLVPRSTILKEWLLLASSVCMLLTLPRFDLRMLATLLGVCLITYVCATLLANGERFRNRRARWAVAASGIVINVVVLAFFKYKFVQHAILRSVSLAATDFIFVIGISYSSFRAMHFILEAYKNQIKNPSLLSFLNYMLFFPAFISGPIHRYGHYCANSAAARNAPFRSDVAVGLERIVNGLFKKTVLTMVLLRYTLTNAGTPIQDMSLSFVALGLYAQALYLYFDFSGYTDLALGSARIMGFVLPENFDRPFLKKNIQQLWANFHISLTSWLTDYIYWPLVRKLRNAEHLRKRPVLTSNIAIVVTFIVCGIWHGNTPSFVLWGLYHGVGIASVNTYQKWKRQVRHPAARKYFASVYSQAIGTAMTFSFYAIGLLPFVLDSPQIRILLGRLI